MPTSIRVQRVNHINAVVEDFDASVAHFHDLLGAEFMLDLPQREWHACLVATGRVIFELFAPHAFLLNARHGPHYLGLEYQADMEEVRAAEAERGIRIARDIGVALHTHPLDTLGISFEFYDGSFHEQDWELLGGPIKSAAYWRDAHPLGLTGLKGYTVAVDDLAAASAFLRSFIAAEPLYEAARPAVGGRALGLRAGDAVIELVAADGAGAIADQLRRDGQGIRSIVFGVRDVEQARRYFTERAVPLAAGTAPDSIAVPAEANLGLAFEFAA